MMYYYYYYYFGGEHAKFITNFTTKSLQTDVAMRWHFNKRINEY